MFVKQLKLKNFRNYETLNINLHKSLNIIIGDNAQGKTNILESIFFGCFGKSFRTNNDKELILMDKVFNYSKLIVQKKHVELNIEYRIHEKLNKEIKINNNSMKRLSDILGNIYVVLFSPEDLSLVKGSPSIRRNFINRELSNLNRKYYKVLVDYNKVKSQRNKLLKNYNSSQKTILEVYDEQLIEKGSSVFFMRRNFLEKLNQISKEIHKVLTDANETLEIEYLPNINIRSDFNYDTIKERFKNHLLSRRQREMKLGYTCVGPHKDDFKLLINDKDVHKYGSQGQQRTTALSLKMSEIKLIENLTGELPILLLDDVFSELDYKRQSRLLKIFENTQTIITSTNFDKILKEQINSYKLIKIEQGKVVKQ